ncbi:MAG TPA: MarR family transcriptional regulator [Ktedonobacteraceae bacterium]|nr:MarR family transcriptional regulator [Ktedonobacteraceae bacterium]
MEPKVVSQIELDVSRLVSSIFIRIDECDRHLLRQFGLTITQYWALIHLENPQGRSLSELATLLICDKSNVTGVVDRLEKAGLAERKYGKAGDRRYTRVVLTEQGQQLRRHAKAAREQIIFTRLQSFGVESLEQLSQILQQLDSLLATQFANGEVPRFIEQAFKQNQIST